jgi:hypothetical protein
MTWTSEPPTEEGFYLFASKGLSFGGRIMVCNYIFKWHGRLYVGMSPKDKHDYDWVVTLRQYQKWYKDAHWAGPIPEPEKMDAEIK